MNTIWRKRVSWDWAEDGQDHADVTSGPDGWHIAGEHAETRYWITTDNSGAATWVKIITRHIQDDMQELILRRDARGWRREGRPVIPGSADAIDPDIACTALTNTLPIKRLDLAIGERVEIDVLYIPVPVLEPVIARQCYTRRADGYLYENRETGFTALLSVDRGGWVTHYPGVCDMMEPPQ